MPKINDRTALQHLDKQLQTSSGTTPMKNAGLMSIQASIREELREVERILAETLSSKHQCVDHMVNHGIHTGGKRLRPTLILLTALAIGEVTPNHLSLAAVLEMVHMATLVHDDVLDDASTRRHVPTYNVLWSNKLSILFGDYLFTKAFHLAASLGSSNIVSKIGWATNRMCEGEVLQVANGGNLEVTESEYFSIIEAKTAELCSCCCRLAAELANGTEVQIESMARYGLKVGTAFQIADDLLDLVGDSSQTGKSLGTDLSQLKLTLPLIRLRDSVTLDERKGLLDSLRGSDANKDDSITKRLRTSGVLDYSREKACKFGQMACEQLQCLPPSPARDQLEQITQLVVDRVT